MNYSIAQLETLLKIVIESPRETVEESVIKTFWVKELSKELANKRWDKAMSNSYDQLDELNKSEFIVKTVEKITI